MLTDGQIKAAVQAVNSEDDVWITDSALQGDLCISAGASCINSVNTYPRINLWRMIDPKGTYDEIYNRYALISVTPTSGKTSFESPGGSVVNMTLNLDDARKLGVTKWMTTADLSQFNTDKVRAEKVATVNAYTIWELVDVS